MTRALRGAFASCLLIFAACGTATTTTTDAQPTDAGVADAMPDAGPNAGAPAVTGGIGTLGPAPAPAGTYRIYADGFEYADRLCAGNTCITGGVTP